MKKESQVCSLEQGKKLNELLRTGEDVVPATFYHFNGEVTSEAWGKDYYPAFTVAELGVMCGYCVVREQMPLSSPKYILVCLL